MNRPATGAAAATLPTSADIDALRARLVQLIDTLSLLQSQLFQASTTSPVPTTANPGMLPYKELLSRYNLILSHVVGLNAILTSVNDADRRGLRDARKDKWDSAAVLPRVPIEDSKDWIAGILLRTKQMPDVEAYQAKLVESIPDTLKDDKAVKDHVAMLEKASFVVNEMKSSLNGEEWEWKARVHTEEEDVEKEQEQAAKNKRDTIPLKDLLAYQRTGRLPDSMTT